MSKELTLQQKLASEARHCEQCGYEINNPMTDRCPRCFAHVQRMETNCGSCTHQGNCEFAHAYAKVHEEEKE
ncbi:MAG: hypothetical protein CL946_01865 [Ectothiorhodospiraceae bacterium]|nr:hypothetical protein [Ectothiorhodospiraceae bacterium]